MVQYICWWITVVLITNTVWKSANNSTTYSKFGQNCIHYLHFLLHLKNMKLHKKCWILDYSLSVIIIGRIILRRSIEVCSDVDGDLCILISVQVVENTEILQRRWSCLQNHIRKSMSMALQLCVYRNLLIWRWSSVYIETILIWHCRSVYVETVSMALELNMQYIEDLLLWHCSTVCTQTVLVWHCSWVYIETVLIWH
jgi:hypothetical protein